MFLKKNSGMEEKISTRAFVFVFFLCSGKIKNITCNKMRIFSIYGCDTKGKNALKNRMNDGNQNVTRWKFVIATREQNKGGYLHKEKGWKKINLRRQKKIANNVELKLLPLTIHILNPISVGEHFFYIKWLARKIKMENSNEGFKGTENSRNEWKSPFAKLKPRAMCSSLNWWQKCTVWASQSILLINYEYLGNFKNEKSSEARKFEARVEKLHWNIFNF